jgi:hypothetical protein
LVDALATLEKLECPVQFLRAELVAEPEQPFCCGDALRPSVEGLLVCRADCLEGALLHTRSHAEQRGAKGTKAAGLLLIHAHAAEGASEKTAAETCLLHGKGLVGVDAAEPHLCEVEAKAREGLGACLILTGAPEGCAQVRATLLLAQRAEELGLLLRHATESGELAEAELAELRPKAAPELLRAKAEAE